MNEFKGTPGPWEAVGEDLDDFRVRAVAGQKKGQGYSSERTVCEEIRKREDALLIAAAPRLYAALARLTQAAQDANVGYLDAAVAEGWDALEIATSNSN